MELGGVGGRITDYRERTLKDVITHLEPVLFK